MDADDRLDALLARGNYSELSAEDRAFVDAELGGAEAFVAERALRKRIREALGAEMAPRDPGGAARLMHRAKPVPVGIPWWQAAAAVVLVALLAWWGRGLTQDPADLSYAAVADTVWKQVRVVDTVFLPAPEVAEHPLPAIEEKAGGRTLIRDTARRRRNDAAPAMDAKLAETIATLPPPGQGRTTGGVAATSFPDPAQAEAARDRFR